jgi:hypothetical protein
MEDKITIIEGPPPTFEAVPDGWVLGLNEGPSVADMVMTKLRTFNGPALVERCYKAWRDQQPIYLEFRTSEGLTRQVPIVAARNLSINEGHMLLLWLRLTDEDIELEPDQDEDREDGES